MALSPPNTLALLGTLLALGMVTPVVRAQPATPPSAGDKDTARSLMDLGDQKLAAGDLAGALEAYKGADAIMGVPSTGMALGKIYARIGKLVEARDVLLRVTRYPVTAGESPVFAVAREEAGKLARELEGRIPELTIKVTAIKVTAIKVTAIKVTAIKVTGVEGLSVEIDGKPVAAATLGLPRKVNPGKHRVVATAPGYQAAQKDIELAEKQQVGVELELKRDPNAKPTPKPTPGPGPAPGPGGGGPAEPELRIHPTVWIGGAVAVAGLVAGTVTGALALSQTSTLSEECAASVCGIDRTNDIESSLALSHVSTASFAAAGAGAALALVGWLALSGREAPGDMAVAPLFVPDSGVPAGLGIWGRF